ncbi:zinc ribbon domain-containing protein [Haloferax namakaokahaiae]|uniref:Zinc ribbon domain-containing protein n=1 Tax=Haloferax namakaokahaiae TaxID=1748331 RepID=A0ABD5ZH11_9EURY
MADARRRALVAALVGVLGASLGIAGAGHVYLREWRRAVAWFSFVVGVALVLVSTFASPTVTSLDSLPPEVTVPVIVLLFLSALDAYRIAFYRGQQRADGTPTCPACGGGLDYELTFCPWCATEIEWQYDQY